MKQQKFLCGSVLFIVSVMLGLAFLNTPLGANIGLPPPTPAPSPTAGPRPEIKKFEGSVLDKPLTRKQAVQTAYEFDKKNAVWGQPWSVDDLGKNPERITVERSETRNINGEKIGPIGENGPIWIITIRGEVKWNGFKGNDRIHDGMVYQISQNTGNIVGYRIGITK